MKIFLYKAIKKTIVSILLVGLFFSLHAQQDITITYIANEGFLITSDTNKILIDGIFSEGSGTFYTPPAEELIKERNATSPFDNIDIVCVSHVNADHVDPAYLVEHLTNNMSGNLIAPLQVVDELAVIDGYSSIENRIKSISWGNQSRFDTTKNGIQVKSFRFSHANNKLTTHNLGYLIKVNGFTIFHTGDSDPAIPDTFQLYNLAKDSIDIAFIHRGFFDSGTNSAGVQIINYLKPKAIIIMHIKIGDFDEYREKVDEIEGIPTVYFMEEQMSDLDFIKDKGEFYVDSDTNLTSLTQDENTIFIVAPNPTDGYIKVKINRNYSETNKINLINSDGKCLLSRYFQNETSIDLSGFSKGIYFIKIDGIKYTLCKKICFN